MKIYDYVTRPQCAECGMCFGAFFLRAKSGETVIIEHPPGSCPNSGKKFRYRLPEPREVEEIKE